MPGPRRRWSRPPDLTEQLDVAHRMLGEVPVQHPYHAERRRRPRDALEQALEHERDRMNQLVAPTSFITSTSRRRAKIAMRIVLRMSSDAANSKPTPRPEHHLEQAGELEPP